MGIKIKVSGNIAKGKIASLFREVLIIVSDDKAISRPLHSGRKKRICTPFLWLPLIFTAILECRSDCQSDLRHAPYMVVYHGNSRRAKVYPAVSRRIEVFHEPS